MLKKSLLSLAVTTSLVGLAGCNISSTADNNKVDSLPLESGTPEYIQENAATLSTTYPLFNPAKTLPTGLVEAPVTLDLLFKGGADADCTDEDSDGLCDLNGKPTTDGTIPLAQGNAALGAVDGDGNSIYNPIFSAVADLDGFSTTAQMDIPFSAGIDASSVIGSGSDATVFVIPLVYPAGEDPLLTTESPTPGAPVAIDASVITYATSTTASATGAGSVLRISPTAPLDPATRYIIVLTDGIKDSNGKAVIPSPLYSVLSSSANFLTGQDAGTKSKAALQTAIQGYEALASGYFGAAGMSYTADNIVFSFSFTTGGTTAVLNSMAAPANFVAAAVDQATGEAFNITLPAKYRYTLEANIDGNPANIPAAANAVWAQLDADSGDANPVVAGTANAVLTALGADQTAQVTSLNGLGAIHNAIPSPAPRVSDFSLGSEAVNLGGLGTVNTDIRVADGNIKLPQYTASVSLPADLVTYQASVSAAAFGFWESDDSLGTDLAAIGVDASKVTPPSTNVTRLFPLAELVEYLDVPVSVVYDTTCAGQYTPVIFQHGITSNRSSGFAIGAKLATEDECIATVMIDLPQHGLLPGGTLTAITADSGENADAYLNRQRHFGLKRLGSSPVPMTEAYVDLLTAGQETAALAAIDAAYDDLIAAATGDAKTALQTEKATAVATAQATAAGTNTAIKAKANKSGDFFINLESFQSTRDHMRQAVMDLLNLNASLAYMNFDNAGGADDFDFDVSKVHFIGHSLGAILGANFVAVNNANRVSLADIDSCKTCNVTLPEITTATLANPGGGVVSLLENSGSFAGTIVGGLETLGATAGLDLSQGSSLFELTKNIFQATVDSGDSINFAAQLKATGTPLLTFQVVGDGTNLPDQTIPSNTLPGNTVIATVEDPEDSNSTIDLNTYKALPSYLSGSDPLIAELGQTQVSATQDTDAALNAVVKFTDGTHSSFADSTSVNAVHNEMNSILYSFISTAGQDLTITDASPVVQTAP